MSFVKYNSITFDNYISQPDKIVEIDYKENKN